MTFAYVDLETTGLNAGEHDMVEVAWAIDDGIIQSFVPWHSLETADPAALAINGYYSRKLNDTAMWQTWNSPIAQEFRNDLKKETLVGSSPAFDASFLTPQVGAVWDHRLLDLPLYAAGLFGWEKSRGLKATIEYVRELGFTHLVDPDHTAAGDVFATRELHYAILKIASVRRFISVEDNARVAKEILSQERMINTFKTFNKDVTTMTIETKMTSEKFKELGEIMTGIPVEGWNQDG